MQSTANDDRKVPSTLDPVRVNLLLKFPGFAGVLVGDFKIKMKKKGRKIY